MKVMRITPHFFRLRQGPVPFDPVGGLQTQVWRLAEELDRIGIDQTVLTIRVPGNPLYPKHFQSMQVQCVGLPVTWFLGAARHLLRHGRQYDLVHLHYNHSIWCRALAMIAHGMHLPVVATFSTQLWVDRGADSRLSNWIEKRIGRSWNCL